MANSSRKYFKEGLSVRKTANKFSVAPSTVSRIKKAELVLI